MFDADIMEEISTLICHFQIGILALVYLTHMGHRSKVKLPLAMEHGSWISKISLKRGLIRASGIEHGYPDFYKLMPPGNCLRLCNDLRLCNGFYLPEVLVLIMNLGLIKVTPLDLSATH